MNEPNIPVQSLSSLIISMVSAVVLAFIILITVVGPAEFGIDPTGFGKAMGLTALADTPEQAIETVLSCPVSDANDLWTDIVIITVPAESGLEYKFQVNEADKLVYDWVTDGADLYFDFHGEPAGDTTGYFKSYKEATLNQSTGVLNAPFTGIHGWYWENKTPLPVKVTLKTHGQYRVKGLM